MRAWSRATERQKIEQRDVDIPPLNLWCLDYLRMKISDLTPNDMWDTSRNDYELAHEIQNAYHAGQRDARETYETPKQG